MGPTSDRPTAAVDWAEVRRRVDAAGAFLEHGTTPSPEAQRLILASRAKTLARELPQLEAGAAADSALEVVEFQLAQERYGLESYAVCEVYPLKEFTPLPGTPPYVLGIINVRGQVLSVLDLKKFFDLPERGLTELNKVIILRSADMEFGLLADAVLGVRRIALSELQASLPTLTGIREEYLRGVTRERLVVLDAEKLLANKALIVHDEVEA